MNTIIPFEIAKLLHKKGIIIDCDSWWVETLEHVLDVPRDGEMTFDAHPPRVLGHKPKTPYDTIHCTAPTVGAVVMKLYEKHGIWISIKGDDNKTFKYELHIWNWYEPEKTLRLGHIMLGKGIFDVDSKEFNSPTEAYNEAISYVLENLI